MKSMNDDDDRMSCKELVKTDEVIHKVTSVFGLDREDGKGHAARKTAKM